MQPPAIESSSENQPVFPPLLAGHDVPPGVTSHSVAVAQACADKAGAGDLYWSRSEDRLSMAIVLEPDVPLDRATQMHHTLLVAFGDAFGAIAPPEIAVHYRWPGDILVNGAKAGEVTTFVPEGCLSTDVPKWLVVALDVAITLDLSVPDPGERMDATTLHEEGAGDVERTMLLESVSRHFLTWIDTWTHDGFKPVHENWTGRMAGDGKEVQVDHAGSTLVGRMTGMDEDGNLLFTTGEGETRDLPLLDVIHRVKA